MHTSPSDDAEQTAETVPAVEAEIAPRRRKNRRVTTEPPPGSDPSPAPEPPRLPRGDNDARMRADKPPHY